MRRLDALRQRKREPGSAAASARSLETLGLILIVVLILAFTLSRSWHYIHWGAH